MNSERVEIVGFRGINRLSRMLEQNNVLIGENAWGKSSLLDDDRQQEREHLTALSAFEHFLYQEGAMTFTSASRNCRPEYR